MALPRAFRFGQDLWDPEHRFETSWLLSPWVLFFFRALFGFYIFFVQVFVLAYYCAHDELGGCTESQNEFSYFTVLTYWGLGFYFATAAVQTATYAVSGTPLLARLPRPLQALHALFYTTVTVYPFVVTVVYWGILYTPPWFPVRFEAWSNVSQHGMNSLFALFEVILTRTNPHPLVHMLWLIVILALYLALAYITRATKGFYVYDFLDPAQGSGLTAGYIFGIAVGCLLFFWFSWGLIWLRRYLTEKRMGWRGRFFADQPRALLREDEPDSPSRDVEMATTGAVERK